MDIFLIKHVKTLVRWITGPILFRFVLQTSQHCEWNTVGYGAHAFWSWLTYLRHVLFKTCQHSSDWHYYRTAYFIPSSNTRLTIRHTCWVGAVQIQCNFWLASIWVDLAELQFGRHSGHQFYLQNQEGSHNLMDLLQGSSRQLNRDSLAWVPSHICLWCTSLGSVSIAKMWNDLWKMHTLEQHKNY